jgi:hypothetical protein
MDPCVFDVGYLLAVFVAQDLEALAIVEVPDFARAITTRRQQAPVGFVECHARDCRIVVCIVVFGYVFACFQIP